ADQAELEVRLRMDVDPDPAPDDIGALQLRMPGVSYALRVDGAERSALGELRLPIGAHVIEIDASERQPWRGEVSITPQQSLVVAPSLEWTPDARSARVAAADSQRTAGQVLTILGGVLVAAGVPLMIWNESEIASTDARLIALEPAIRACVGMMGAPACDAIRTEALQLSDRQGDQDILRAVSVAGAITGALAATIGIVLWASAPSETSIDTAAHASLRLDPRGLQLSGSF
ncbi:MAG: hypothetical protein M3Y87_31010, partial [Myxococcota bacterium]|nr:hypothetical protein [Myxococcota bacterium]